ncbi:peptide-methionine (S)-S-oxide reductase MsrA [Ruegeria sp. R14_0]|uniref:peptide-methionine (S)-S-oxide reductase MsrA n=1 Tax=Ruegeria sp. R14_0 TaxID=2821100 RepID=UPI001ADCEA57|nr:peptide-methionine (S)-S-oxide reductase MsrA [Ruegeria sp. R14_0]MBO9446049.1 peptide-methionine (S)-S-oxide reductase MsrA [Ruegeria sp. R14_0]
MNRTAYLDFFKPTLLFVLIALAAMLRALPAPAAGTETLTVAGGCFWCVESDFESVPGVIGAVSGYTGGKSANPTYDQVSKGGTGHYEAVQITFDPARVSRETLLNMFFRSVDPTDAGGQFCDRGDSYRTAIFVSNAGEKTLAQKAKANAQQALGQTVVTPILDAGAFYPAEAYHQDYYKGDKLVLTRFGPKRQKNAYKAYRKACGRDARVKQLWGSNAPFVGS